MSDFDRIKHIKAQKDKVKKIRRDIKLGKVKTGKKDKPIEQPIIDPGILRNRLAVEYNRLIRENNPDTKKLREQIRAEIQKIEKSEESKIHVTS